MRFNLMIFGCSRQQLFFNPAVAAASCRLHPLHRRYSVFRFNPFPVLGAATLAAGLGTGLAEAAETPASESADAPTSAPTQSEAPGDARAAYLPTTTIIGSAAQERRLPGSGTFLDEVDIRRHGYDDVNKVLRKVPGVYIREEEGFGLFPNLSLRGVDPGRSSKVTLMEDGIPTAPAPYSAPAAYYAPTVGRMSGLEVLKGSSQVRYGPHTTGGVVNYLSTPIPDGQRFYLRTQYGAFTDNDGNGADIRAHAWYGNNHELGNGAGTIGYVIEGYARENDGFKSIDGAPDFTGTDETGLHNAEAMFKVFWEPDSQIYQRIEYKIGYSDREADVSYLGLTEDDFDADPFRRYSASRFDEINTWHTRMYLRHTIEPADWLTLTTTGYYNRFHRNWFKLDKVNGNNLSEAIAGGGGDLDTLRGDAAGTLKVKANNRDYYLWGIQSFAEMRFATEGIDHEVTAGLRYHEDRIRRFQWAVNFTQDANGAISGSNRTAGGTEGNRRQETNALAFSLEDRMSFGKWTLTPGIRVEYIDHEWIEFDDNPSNIEVDGGSDAFTMIAGGLGATYDWSPRWQTFGGLHRGVSPPSPKGNIDGGLDEESSIAFEIGQRLSMPEQALSATGTFFFTHFDDLVVTDNIGGSGSGDDENVGEVNSLGIELGGEWDAGVANQWGFGNPWFLAFTYTDADLDGDAESSDPESIFSGGRDGNQVPYIPEFQIAFGTGLEFDRWGIDVRVTWVDEVFATANNSSSQVRPDGTPDARFGKIDDYVTVDLSGYYQVNENTRLFAGVNNLFDEEYMASRLPHGPRPGQSRFAFVGAELQF